MIKLKSLLKESEEEINQDRLIWNDSYLDDVAEQFGYDDDFNKLFWNQPYIPMLYHCTTKENYELIRKDGMIRRRSDTRGISNRTIGSSIFTTREEEEVSHLKSYYGPIVLTINAKQMKQDGYTPNVEQEPEWSRAIKLAFVLTKLTGKEVEASRYVDSSDQVSEGTVILYGNVPIKYVSLVEYD